MKAEINILTVEDVKKIFSIGRNNAYELMHREDFPSFKIGKKLFINQDALYKWIENQSNSQLS